MNKQRQRQAEVLLAIRQHDVLHLVDTILDVGPNRWVNLKLAENERTASVRIEPDGWLTGFLSGAVVGEEKGGATRGKWSPDRLIGRAVGWMEVGRGSEGEGEVVSDD